MMLIDCVFICANNLKPRESARRTLSESLLNFSILLELLLPYKQSKEITMYLTTDRTPYDIECVHDNFDVIHCSYCVLYMAYSFQTKSMSDYKPVKNTNLLK